MWTLLPWAFVAVALAILLYRKKTWVKEITSTQRTILILLRSLGLIALGILLLGILIKGIQTEVNSPILLTVVDNSTSMTNYADSNEVEAQTKAFLNSANDKLNQDFDHLIYSLDGGIKSVDSLRFSFGKTNLSSRLNKLYDNYYGRNIGGIILLSDGNYNAGSSPLLTANKFKNIPIYSLSVGDTIQKVDHLISNVTANEIAFLDNQFPVEVSIEGSLTPNKKFKLALKKEGKIIKEKLLNHQNEDYSLIKTTFLLDATDLGIHEYTVGVDVLDNESNVENNEKSFYVEVLDDRSKILIVSEGLNPDVGAIKSALNKENNLELDILSPDELPNDFSEIDLIIWSNPGASNNEKSFKFIESQNIPVWYLFSDQTSSLEIANLGLSSQLQIRNSSDLLQAAPNKDFSLFKLSAETQKSMRQFPPLTAPYGKATFSDASSILAYQSIGGIQKSQPLMYFNGKDKDKYAITLGSGLWKWRLSDYQMNQEQEHFNEIIQKSVQYLILKENTSRLRVQIPSLNNSTEDFVLKSTFFNESYEPITQAEIALELTNEEGKQFDYSFLPMSEEYQLNLGKLNAGRYEWQVSTKFNGETFTKKGAFAIKDVALEKQSTKANHRLMRQLAENNMGKFAMLQDYEVILEDIQNRNDIVPVSYESSTYHKLIDYFWLLLIVVGIFTAEWTLRRYLGGY